MKRIPQAWPHTFKVNGGLSEKDLRQLLYVCHESNQAIDKDARGYFLQRVPTWRKVRISARVFQILFSNGFLLENCGRWLIRFNR